jgi:hypothetical protein
MGVPTNPNQPDLSAPGRYEEIKPPVIEWIHNDPKTTKHLPCPDSSWLQSVSYDSGSLRMTVTTKKGDSWQHGQVYPAQFQEMQLHPSKGSFYAKNIKGKHVMTTIIRTSKANNFPKETPHAPKDRFKNPLYDNFTRYKSKGRYS